MKERVNKNKYKKLAERRQKKLRKIYDTTKPVSEIINFKKQRKKQKVNCSESLNFLMNQGQPI